MATRDEFVQTAISAGLTDPAKLKAAMEERRRSIGAFDDETQNLKNNENQSLQKQKGGPFKTLFPLASSVQNDTIPIINKPIPFGKEIKQNLAAGVDMLGWVDRGVDAATGGQLSKGRESLKSMVPGEGVVSENIKTGIDIATSPSTFIGAGAVKNIFTKGPQKAIETASKQTMSQFAKSPLQATGEAVESAGKQFKLGDLKIKDTVAKKAYGKDLIEKKQGIANTISDWGLTKGNNQKSAEKAGDILDEIFTKTEEVAKDVATRADAPRKNPVQAMTKNLNIEALVDIDEEEFATNFVESLKEKFAAKGLDGDLTIDKLIEAKKMLDRKGTLFKNGPSGVMETDLKTAIKKKMYLNIVNEIAELSPELKNLNTEAKKLFSAQEALASAASRTANKDAISLTDWIMGASVVVDPKALPVLAVKKGLANGRGSNLVINAGRAIKGKKVLTVDNVMNGNKGGNASVKELLKQFELPENKKKYGGLSGMESE